MERNRVLCRKYSSPARLSLIEKLIDMSRSQNGFTGTGRWWALKALSLINSRDLWMLGIKCILTPFTYNGHKIETFNSHERTVISKFNLYSLVVVVLPDDYFPTNWSAKTEVEVALRDMVTRIINGSSIMVKRTKNTNSFPVLTHPISGMPLTRLVCDNDGRIYDTYGYRFKNITYHEGKITVENKQTSFWMYAMEIEIDAIHFENCTKTLGSFWMYGSVGDENSGTSYPGELTADPLTFIMDDIRESWGIPNVAQLVPIELQMPKLDDTVVSDFNTCLNGKFTHDPIVVFALDYGPSASDPVSKDNIDIYKHIIYQ
jgi:hypothetical protein